MQLAVKVVEPPAETEAGCALRLQVGADVLTVTVALAVFPEPPALLPCTV